MAMSAAAPTEASKSHIWSLFMASDYEFLPEGVRVFKGHFDQVMRDQGIFAKIDYKRTGHFFEITCAAPNSRIVFQISHDLYTTLIKTEIGDDDEDFKSNLIAKVSPGPGDLNNKTEPVVEELISLDLTAVWKCHTQDMIMDRIIPKYVQAAIENITSTKLVEDLNGQAIHVHAQSREDRDKAIHKLDVLRKYHDLACRHVHHLFLTEENDNFELGIRTLSEINQKLVETTLLDPLYGDFKFEELLRAYTVRLFPFTHIRNAFLLKIANKSNPSVLEKNKNKKGMVFDLWLGYQYPGMGGKHLKRTRTDQFQPLALQPVGSDDQVRKWLEAGISNDPNDTVEEMEEDMKQAVKFGSSVNPQDPYSANSGMQQTEQALDNFPTREPLDSVDNNVLAPRPAAELKDDFLGIPANRRSIYRSPGMRDLRTGNSSRSENIRGSSVSQSLLDIDIQEDEQNNLSNIPISLPLKAMPRSSNSIALEDRRHEFFSNPHNRQSLLDSDVPESDGYDLKLVGDDFGGQRTPDTTLPTIKEETEVNNRAYDCTMNQRAPRPAEQPDKGKDKTPLLPQALVAFADLNIKNSTKDFGDEMKANANIILTSLRNYNGEITLECHFGRILIKQFAPSIMRSLEKAHSVPTEHMCELLLTNQKKLSFTKSITNLPEDVHFLLNMRIEETNQRIWSDAAQWTVKYEYVCCDHEDYGGICMPGIIIEMDADSLETNVKSAPINFGNLNVHGTIRNWDYVISATGSQNLEEDYGDLVEAIKTSTYIAPGSKTVSMSFELSQRYQIHFQSIRVRRHSRYKSYDGRTLLNITEVHNLDFDWEEGENAITFFVTSSEKPNSMWYEVSLESVEARIAFQDNLNVELGEETEWTAELLLESGVVWKDICVPANYIITKMDGVGFYNDNGTKPLLATAESAASKKLPHEKRPGSTKWETILPTWP